MSATKEGAEVTLPGGTVGRTVGPRSQRGPAAADGSVSPSPTL
jgi:hypothetical protein